MAQFNVNVHRFDPYKNFKFRLKWDGRYVAGISKAGALKRTTEVVRHREGGVAPDVPVVLVGDPGLAREVRARDHPEQGLAQLVGRLRSRQAVGGVGADDHADAQAAARGCGTAARWS